MRSGALQLAAIASQIKEAEQVRGIQPIAVESVPLPACVLARWSMLAVAYANVCVWPL